MSRCVRAARRAHRPRDPDHRLAVHGAPAPARRGDAGAGQPDAGGGVPAGPRLLPRHAPALAAELTAAGLPVEVHVEGDRDHIPAALDLTAYRLVQESLTNVVKHAGPAHAQVTVRYQPGAVSIEVVDDGHPSAVIDDRKDPGHGQLGMRERVAIFGGSITAGARADGGYRVAARLPYVTAER